MEHLILTVFTVCIQIAIGIMVFAAIGRWLNKDGVFRNAIFTAAIFGIVGMMASLLHLGQPLRALYSLSQFGSSWLSREIWFTGIFIGLTVISAAIIYFKPEARNASNVIVSVAALVGLVDVFVMASIYSNTSVPVWQNVATFVEFYGTAISVGAMVFLILSMKEAMQMRRIAAAIVAIAVAVQVLAVIPFLVAMGTSSSAAVQSSLEVLNSMSLASLIKWAMILSGSGVILWINKNELSQPIMRGVLGSTILLLAGQFIGRYIFYAMMVLPRVGLS